MIKLGYSNILKCFDIACVGTRVTHPAEMLDCLDKAIKAFDWAEHAPDGQAFIPLPAETIPWVLGGVAKKSRNPDDFVNRLWRGHVGQYMKREFALPVERVSAIVYTRQAYLDDPDCKGDPENGIPRDQDEIDRIEASDYTHILVIIIADDGTGKAPVSPGTFVNNLAGGNNAYAKFGKDELVDMAINIRDYYRTYSTVAD
jgi:hypothetical protein